MGLQLRALTAEMSFKSAESKALYEFVLVEIMKKMQNHLEAMKSPTGEEYETYLKSVQKIAANIKHYGAGICQLSRFFLVPSRHYQPPEDDPEFYTQGILNYSSHLGSGLKSTSSALFYYLLGGWKKALVSGTSKVRDHKRHIKRAMRQADFLLFLLDDFLPAILQTGFRHLLGRESMMYLAYFPYLADEIGELLNGDEPLAGKVSELVMNLLRIIMNCLLAKYEHTVYPRFPMPTGDERSARSTACLFWVEVTPHMENYTRRVGGEHTFQEVNEPFLRYLQRMDDHLDPPHLVKRDWLIPQWTVKEGKWCAGFEKALEDDIRDHFQIEGNAGTIKMGVTTHRVELSALDKWIPTFMDVLQLGRVGRFAVIPAVYNSQIMDPEFIF